MRACFEASSWNNYAVVVLRDQIYLLKAGLHCAAADDYAIADKQIIKYGCSKTDHHILKATSLRHWTLARARQTCCISNFAV